MSAHETNASTLATVRALPPRRTGLNGWWLLGGVIVAGGVALFAATAFAERGWGPSGWGYGWGPGGWGYGGRHGMMDSRGGPGPRGERFSRFCAEDTARWQPVARLFVKTDLRLSEAQGQAFDRFADVAFPGFEEVKREACNAFVARAGAAPDRLAQMAVVLRKAADATERAIEPARTFYNGLDEAQKARVDQALDRGRRWQRGMWGPGMMGPGMMGPGMMGPGGLPPRP